MIPSREAEEVRSGVMATQEAFVVRRYPGENENLEGYILGKEDEILNS